MLSRVLLLFFLVILIFLANGFINPIPERKADSSFKPIYGTSYSFEQAGWYGLNPRGTYIKLLDDFNFDWIRLPFFWDEMVDQSGKLVIDDLKFAIEEAKKRKLQVSRCFCLQSCNLLNAMKYDTETILKVIK